MTPPTMSPTGGEPQRRAAEVLAGQRPVVGDGDPGQERDRGAHATSCRPATPASPNVAISSCAAQAQAQHGERRGRAGALAEAHAEVEHRAQAEVLEQQRVGGLGGEVPGEQARQQRRLDRRRPPPAAAVAMTPSQT
jgi:hypothetical protein